MSKDKIKIFFKTSISSIISAGVDLSVFYFLSTVFERKYFYVPFLLTDDIMLDERFFPDFNIHGADLKVVCPTYRILEHVRKKNEQSKNYRDRLNDILVEHGDDYGAAQLIVEYLSDIDSSKNYENICIVEKKVFTLPSHIHNIVEKPFQRELN